MSWQRKFPLLLLAALSLFQGGCIFVAAGAAGAGAATYFYLRGKLCQEYYASFADSWQAVLTTLQEQGFTVTRQENNGADGTISSKTTDGSAITISLTSQASRAPAEKNVTRVCIRIGAWGDEPLSARLLTQIGSHLVPTGLQPAGVPTATTPTSSPIRPASWSEPRETAPPPELPREPIPIGR